ncbi:TPA: hypothetical protein QCY85_005517 [Bacillus cereus]|nr:hypothetical protein [Bacillus cereus]HDR8117885.1 hypothetical protein [Bacillus cereus]
MEDVGYQASGKVKALYHQGYNIGKMKLDAALAKGSKKKGSDLLYFQSQTKLIRCYTAKFTEVEYSAS